MLVLFPKKCFTDTTKNIHLSTSLTQSTDLWVFLSPHHHTILTLRSVWSSWQSITLEIKSSLPQTSIIISSQKVERWTLASGQISCKIWNLQLIICICSLTNFPKRGLMKFPVKASGLPSGAAHENMSGSVYCIFRKRRRFELLILHKQKATNLLSVIITKIWITLNLRNGFVTYRRPLK